MNNDVDINVLVSLYNQKLAALTNQNVLLEAKLQTLIKDFESERENLLAKISELTDRQLPSTSEKTKSSKKIEDYQNSEVE
jgi:hypothetical protein